MSIHKVNSVAQSRRQRPQRSRLALSCYTPIMARKRQKPRCVVIAGPNGAGKTTFARRYLPENARVIHFVNADLIASGLSPLRPELAAIAAARVFSKSKQKGVLHI